MIKISIERSNNMIEKKEEILKPKKETKKIDRARFPIMICIIIVLILCIIFIPKLLLNISSNSLEKKLSNSLVEMGSEFYTENYYDGLFAGRTDKEAIQILKGFESMGIKIDLENLGKYNPDKNTKRIEEFKNIFSKKCNQKNTKAVIYPKKPYGKNDYKVEAEIDCGFGFNNSSKK